MDRRFLHLSAVALLAAGLASCSGDDAFVGSWTAAAPVSLQADIPAASSATSLMSLDFTRGDSGNGVYLSSLINATQPVVADSLSGAVEPYEVSVSATAGVRGTWTRSGDDDLLLAFDMSSLKVEVDPAGVMFSQNMLTGAGQPAVDSLTARTAAIWQRQIERAVRGSLIRYSRLEDVEVDRDRTTLQFEIKNAAGRDVDMVMHRVINGD
ncbi:MAG: hypothetical protein NC406_00535 [Bacteroides sp.]|nr:hypothetical protein [Bacteroides sp.]MCM1094771.1 hypothetical protein [Terasakiella sp.]